ncbi:hypothetical protein [Lentzea sp. NPDC092896]|uniref:hypothetical protein n=1 Tax=Lentzea sp. NPDC092896 TaxID=3364127 RepID=UPI003815676E
MADNNNIDSATPMLNLVQHMAGGNTAANRRASDEVQRRWDTAVQYRNAELQVLFPPGRTWHSQSPTPDDVPYHLAAIDDARQLLSVMTLVHELAILQRAGVHPAELFIQPDGPGRVFEELNAEHDLSHTGPSNDPLETDAAQLFARWVERSLFGASAQVLRDHREAAGFMHPDGLQWCIELTRRACARLEGPWTLESFLTNPVGSGYYLPQTTSPRSPYEGTAVALGRQGAPLGKAEIDASRAQADADLAAEINRVIAEDPPKDLPELRDMPQDKLAGMHAEMRSVADLLAAALCVRRLAEDHGVRLDGRLVAPGGRGWVLDHLISRARFAMAEVGTLTLAGTQVTFARDDRGVVATVDAAGIRKEFASDSLRDILAVLEFPGTLTTVAKMRAGVDRIGEHLSAERASPSRRGVRGIDPRRSLHYDRGPNNDGQRRHR